MTALESVVTAIMRSDGRRSWRVDQRTYMEAEAEMRAMRWEQGLPLLYAADGGLLVCGVSVRVWRPEP